MKSVLISIQPKWCELIASGKKTIEARKTAPQLETPFKCYIYETKGLCDTPTFIDESGYMSFRGKGQVIEEFICDYIERYEFDPQFGYYTYGYHSCKDDLRAMCLTREEFTNYGKGKTLYGLHISDLKIYDTPKELREYKQKCREYGSGNPNCDGCKYFIDGVSWEYDESDCAFSGYKPLTRPPQSWCYVEGCE